MENKVNAKTWEIVAENVKMIRCSNFLVRDLTLISVISLLFAEQYRRRIVIGPERVGPPMRSRENTLWAESKPFVT